MSDMQQTEKRRPPTTARAQHRLFQDWAHVSRWIGANLHTGKRAQSILGAFDCRPLLATFGGHDRVSGAACGSCAAL